MAGRELGSGLPMLIPVWYPLMVKGKDTNVPSRQCAYDQGRRLNDAQPQSQTHFNHHPQGRCRYYHPHAVDWVWGCSIHYGWWIEGCQVCKGELDTGQYVLAKSLREKVGYPGDDQM